MSIKTVYQAYTRAPLGEITLHSQAQADEMLTIAQGLFKNKDAWLPIYQRIEILEKMVVLLREQRETLVLQIANEGGKPLTDAYVEADRAVEGVKIAIRTLATESGQTVPMGVTPACVNRLAFTHLQPIGVVLAVSAFNHPLNLIIHQVIPAIATGCPVIIKPALSVPSSCLQVADIAKQAGLPDGWLQVCLTPDDITENMVTDPRLGFFSFIGSAKVGWWLRSKLANGTRCALEHGGVAPVIVDKNTDLDSIVPLLGKAGFYHAGQVCVSVQRVFADKQIATELAEKLVVYAQTLTVGDAIAIDTDVGPLIEPYEIERAHQWVTESQPQVLCGGERLGKTTYAPTVILNPDKQSKVARCEVFAPVIAVFSYDNRLQAIAEANSLDMTFQASVFSQHIDIAMDTARRLDASAVMINDPTTFRVDWMPFAGYRQSGYGVGGIPHTMKDLWQEKMLVIHSQGLA